MATKSPFKLTDLLKPGVPMSGGVAFSNGLTALQGRPGAAPAPTLASPVMNPKLTELYSGARTPMTQTAPRRVAAPAPAPAPSAAPVPVPVGETGAAPAAQNPLPQKWMKADGTIKTPAEIASEVTAALKASSTGGDIGRIAGAEFGSGEKSAEQLATDARRISNTRNDIATGQDDPYGIASESGIAYTPAELAAIEKSYAGIYDPALDSAMSKLEARKKADDEAAKARSNAAAEEKKWERELEKMAKEHGYDLEKMQADQKFQYGLAAYKASLDAKNGGGASGMTPYSDERSQRTLQSVDELSLLADASPGIFGRSAATPIPEFLRTDDYRNFTTQLDTLKASIAFNELTAMREASKTGGALGNVSNIELGLLESALGGLKMSQTPESFKTQLNKVKTSINRWRAAQGAATVGAPSGSSGGGAAIPAGTDGASYGFPGYKSDGKQWVQK